MRKIAILSSVILLGLAAVVVAADLRTSHSVTGPIPSAGEQALLYSQISNPSGGGAAAQDFEAAYDAYDCYVGDDFQVTWADGWQIEQIHAPGSYSLAGPALGIVYGFYGDAGGFPGTTLCSGTASIVSDNAGDILSQLPSVCILPVAGTFWVSVAARLDYSCRRPVVCQRRGRNHGQYCSLVQPRRRLRQRLHNLEQLPALGDQRGLPRHVLRAPRGRDPGRAAELRHRVNSSVVLNPAPRLRRGDFFRLGLCVR